MRRPSWDEYFMEITRQVAERATCIRREVGAIVVKDRRILTTGYNGVPVGIRHCVPGNCIREQMKIRSGERHELCRGVHAEQNAIIQGALHGVSVRGGVMYCTNLPCAICAKMIINAGIVEVVYGGVYSDAMSEDLFRESGIKLRKA